MSPVKYHLTCYIVLCYQLHTFSHITYQHIGHIPCLLFRKMHPPPAAYLIGGFFLVCEDFGRVFDNSFPACAFFIFFSGN